MSEDSHAFSVRDILLGLTLAFTVGSAVVLCRIGSEVAAMAKKLECIQLPACDTPSIPVTPRPQEGK